jgi:hypothetical protein
MRIRRLPVIDWTDGLANLNGPVRLAERGNLVSAHVSSHFKHSPMNMPLCHLYTATNFNRFRLSLEKEARMFMTMRRHSCSLTPVRFSHITEQLVGVKHVMLLCYEVHITKVGITNCHNTPLPRTLTPSQFHCKEIPGPVFGAHIVWSYWRLTRGRFTHSMPCPCRAHAVPLPCRDLIHTCHTAPLPCSDSAVSFVKFRVVAGNIRTASATA